MYHIHRKLYSGFTLVELMVAMAIALIVALVLAVLLIGGQRSWQQTYDSAHKQIKEDGEVIAITFSTIARKANRLNYTIYNKSGDTFTPALPQTSNPEEVVSGDAVEFRYWDVEFDKTDSYDLLDVTKTATAYALFYLDDTQLKLDRGSYPPGAVPAGGGLRNTSNATTTILAQNVTVDPNIGVFSHTTLSGNGQGSVRINITLTDPDDNDTVEVMTAALMRNIWPR